MASIDIRLNGEPVRIPAWLVPTVVVIAIVGALIIGNMMRPAAAPVSDADKGKVAYDNSADKERIDSARWDLQAAPYLKGKTIYDYKVEYESPTDATVKIYYRDSDNAKYYVEVFTSSVNSKQSLYTSFKGVKDAD